MTTDDGLILGIDLGGTKIRSMSFDRDMKVIGEDYRETEAEGGPDAVIARMADSARTAAKGGRILCAGVSTPGPSMPSKGVVTAPPNLPGWRNVPLAKKISDLLQVPAWLENDANSAALAEHELGAGKGLQHMILVTLGTGVGGGLVLDGKLYQGASGGAGEVGHMTIVPDGPRCNCGRNGCLEAVASGIAFAREGAALVARSPQGTLARLAAEANEAPSAKLIDEAAQAGDAEAEAIIRSAGRYLGAGLTNLVNIFNPEMIVIGGSLRLMGEPYMGEAKRIVEREAFAQHFADVRIVDAELGDESPAIGAALIAKARI
jgi:glucokinase